MGIVGRLDQYASMLAGEFDDYSMSENLFLYSEQYNQTSWINQGSFETTNAITSPDGFNTAEKLIGNNGQANRQSIYQTVSVTSGTTYTFSVFLKQAERRYATIWFDALSITEGAYYGSATYIDLQTGTIASGNQTRIVAYPNGWYRVYVTATPSFTGSLILNTSIGTPNNAADGAGSIAYQYTGDGVSGFYIWGSQFERGTGPTDYTRTTTTAISRVLPSTTNTNITGLSTYFSSGFSENVGAATTLVANVFPPYDPVYDDFGGTLFGAGQGRYMRQNTDKSVIVYNEIDEVTDFYSRGVIRAGLVLDLDAGLTSSYQGTNYYLTPQTLTNGRIGTSSGGNYTDFSTGGPTGGRFTRWVCDTALTRTTDWHWGIDYSNTGLSVGQLLTVSFYARCPNGTLSNITLNSPDNVIVNGTLDSNWRRYSGTVVYGGDYTSTPFVRINRSNANTFVNGATYDIAQIQIEKGSILTNFVDSTIWTDLSPYGNNGTLTLGPTYSSANGGSIVFDGSNDYVFGTITGSIFTGSFTQSAWIYKLNNNQIWQGVFTNSSPATNNTYLMTFGNGSVAAPYNSVGANQVGVSESGIFLDIGTHTNRWLYIIITKTGSTLNIYCYKDGSLLQTSGTITWNSGNFATTNNYEIGRHWAGGAVVPLQGNVAQVSVYNRALTAAEIKQNYDATKGRFGL